MEWRVLRELIFIHFRALPIPSGWEKVPEGGQMAGSRQGSN